MSKVKDKNHTIISIEAGTSDKIQHPFLKKTLSKTEENFLKRIKPTAHAAWFKKPANKATTCHMIPLIASVQSWQIHQNRKGD